MQRLRSLHLYLGCIFAPLLLFYAVSGIWQTLGIPSKLLQRLSTIHTTGEPKDGSGLSSPALRALIVVMAVSFLVTIALGVVMALRFGRSRRVVMACLAAGVLVPGVLVLWRLMPMR